MPSTTSSATRVLLVCSGLDHAQRGFESFARDAFKALSAEPQLELELVKGSGPSDSRERAVPSLTRDRAIAKAVGRVFSREPFRVEQVVFALSLQAELRRRQPDVVYLSEWHTALVLAWLRRLTNQRFRLVLCNGTMAIAGFGHLDRIQELTPAAMETVLLGPGSDPTRHVMLPLGFAVPARRDPIEPAARSSARKRLGLPVDRQILISVAALNRHHKRIDYLIEEVARLSEPRPFLLLLGQREAQTPGLRALAQERLGTAGHGMLSLAQADVAEFVRASDGFVLASLGEGLPRALIEAAAEGIPCYVHDYAVTRFALGVHGRFGDFSRPGGLARLVSSALAEVQCPERAKSQHDFIYERFSWDRLRPKYVELLRDWPPLAELGSLEHAHGKQRRV